MKKPKTSKTVGKTLTIKSSAETEAEYWKSVNLTDRWFEVLNNVIRFGAVVAISYFAYLMVDSLSGKDTFANIGISMLFDSRVLGIIFGGGGMIYGLHERRLRKRTVKRLQPRIKQWEQSLDPSRTSSRLTDSGDTHPDDM